MINTPNTRAKLVQTLRLFEQTTYVRDRIDFEVPHFYAKALGPLGLHTDFSASWSIAFKIQAMLLELHGTVQQPNPTLLIHGGLLVKARLLEIPANPNCPSGSLEYSRRPSNRYSPTSGEAL